MDRLLFASVLMGILGFGCKESMPSAKVDEEKPVFSAKLPLKPPADWREKVVDGKTLLVGPTIDGFAPNINLVTENSPGDLAAYVNLSVENLEGHRPGIQFLERKSFKTKGGIEGIKCVTLSTSQNSTWRQTYYFFDAADSKKLVFSCTVPADHGEELAPKFDEIIGTYQP